MRDILSLVAVLCGALLILYIADAPSRDAVKRVKSGETKLVCNMFDGEREIDSQFVVDKDGGTWIFKNGSAKSCVELEGEQK